MFTIFFIDSKMELNNAVRLSDKNSLTALVYIDGSLGYIYRTLVVTFRVHNYLNTKNICERNSLYL